MSAIRRMYSRLSIRAKLMFSHIILIAIPTIVVAVFFYSRIYNLVVNDSIRQEQTLSLQTASTEAATLDQVTTVATAVRGNSFLLALLAESGQMTGKNREQYRAELDDPMAKASFHDAVRSQIDGRLITDIRIYTESDDASVFEDEQLKNIVCPVSAAAGSYWHGIFSATSKTELFCPSFYLTDREITECGDLAYIIRIPSAAGTSDKKDDTYIAVYFSKANLTEILDKGISVNDSVSYLINERDSIVATSNVQLSGTYWMDYDTVTEISSTYSEFTTRRILDKDVYAGCHKIGDSDWYMVSILPAAPIVAKGNSIIFNFIVLYLVLLGIAFLFADLMSRSITDRIADVCTGMSEVRKGPPVRMPEPKINDEIGDLVSTYNYMTDKMNQLIEDQEKSAEELRVSEIRALQAQINPHFLYNTMEMINWLSQTGKQKEVTEAIQALSRFYKLTLSKKDIFGTIASETEHVTLYVKLQNMRYSDRIHFVVDIPDDLAEYPIPRLTFQPVVENAILHGILEKEKPEGTIVLTGWMEEEDIVIQISDDGVGIPPEQIDSILSGTGKGGGTNIGVYNTHRRLQVIYGEQYGLKYSSVYGEGTDVEIRIPCKEPDTAVDQA